MPKPTLLLFLLLGMTSSLSGQVWERITQYAPRTFPEDVVETADSGFVFLIRESVNQGDRYLAKFDKYGVTEWVHTFVLPNQEIVELVSIQSPLILTTEQTILAGAVFQGNTARNMGYVEFSLEGELIGYGHIPYPNHTILSSLVETDDGGKLFVGTREVQEDVDYDIITIKVDANDQIEWVDTFGPTSEMTGTRFSLLKMDDGYLIGGGLVGDGFPAADKFIRKLSLTGTEMWLYLSESTPFYTDQVLSLALDSNNHIYYVAQQLSVSGDVVGKLDSAGNFLWERSIPVHSDNLFLSIHNEALCIAADNQPVIIGAYRQDLIMYKLNENGESIWFRLYGGCGEAGDFSQEIVDSGYKIKNTQDGGFIVAGVRGNPSNLGTTSFYALKTDQDGNSFPSSRHTEIDLNLCDGESGNFQGQYYFQAGVYPHFLANPQGICDSLILLHVRENTTAVAHISQTICTGESVMVFGDTLSVEGIYVYTLPEASSTGCDSVVNLTLLVAPPTAGMVHTVLCPGDSLVLGDQVYTTSGEFEVVLAGANHYGCDSVIFLTINFSDSVTLSQANIIEDTGQMSGSISPIFTGGTPPYSYLWSNGHLSPTVNGLPAGVYFLTLTDALGCQYGYAFEVGLVNTANAENETPIQAIVYPNPVKRGEYITVNAPEADDLQVLNSQGQQMSCQVSANYSGQFIVDSATLPPGHYTVILRNRDNRNIMTYTILVF